MFTNNILVKVRENLNHKKKKVETKKENKNLIKSSIDFFNLFPGYSKEDILERFEYLSDNEKKITKLRYGLNGKVALTIGEIAEMLQKERYCVYGTLYVTKNKISLWLKDEAELLMMKRKKERKLNIKSNNKSPIKSLYYTKSNQNKSNRKRKVTNLKSEAEESSKPFVPDENIKCLIEQIQNIEVRYILSLFFGCIGNKRHSLKEIQKIFPSYSEEYILEIVDKFIENNSISNGINRTPKIKQISTM